MPNAAQPATGPTVERMECLEVWGGNRPAQRHLVLTGLDVWIHSRPQGGAAAGGDVYYASSCASGRISRLLVADVSGHGSAVAEVARGLRDMMRRHVNMVRQTRFVSQMNEQFARLGEAAGFATAVVCTYFAPRRSLAVCTAGHPPPLLYRVATGTWSWWQGAATRTGGPSDLPWGVSTDTEYRQQVETLAPGDMLLIYSDGLIEAPSQSGQSWGRAGLLDQVQRLNPQEPASLIPGLLAAMLPGDGASAQDDVTLLLLRPTGTSASLKNNLLALFRLARGVRDKSDVVSAVGTTAAEPRAR